jgi:hypothetical protein
MPQLSKSKGGGSFFGLKLIEASDDTSTFGKSILMNIIHSESARTRDILLQIATLCSEANISSLVFCQQDFFKMLDRISPNLIQFLENCHIVN